MAVDTCRGEKPQSHQPKMLEDGKKVALIGGVIVHFAIGPWCFPAIRLGGGYPVTFGRWPLLFFALCPTILNTIEKYSASVASAVSDSRRAKVCVQGKVRFCYPSRVSLVDSCSEFCDKSLLYSSICLMGSVAERSKALV